LTMIDEQQLANTFVSNLNEIAYDFIKCVGLKYKAEVDNLSDPLLRWIDFRLRYIDPRPRQVYLSKAFPKKMSVGTKNAAVRIMQMIQKGEDINPFQGKGLILHHDTSASNKQKRTDLLWADWGIIHLHVTDKPIPRGQYFSPRVERPAWLLFALAGESFIAFIDIRRHDEENVFENQELIEIVAKSWPKLMGKYEVKGIAVPASEDSLTSVERAQCRRTGVQNVLSIDGKLYRGFGMGITTAATSARVLDTMDNVRKYASGLARLIGSGDSEVQTDVQANKIIDPKLRLCVTPKGMAIFEDHLNKAWLLPKKAPGSEDNCLADLTDIMAPEWAIKQIFTSQSQHPKRKET